MPPASSRSVAIRAAVFCVLTGANGFAQKAERRHQLDDQDLERMHEVSPELARLFAEAEAHLAKAELKLAAEGFARARQGLPLSALAARRHCQALTELGQREEAVAACQSSGRLSRMVMDQRALVGALMTGPKPPTVEQLGHAVRLARLAKRVPELPFGDAAICEIAYRIGDDGMLKHCVENLQRLDPHHYEARRWAAAVLPTPG